MINSELILNWDVKDFLIELEMNENFKHFFNIKKMYALQIYKDLLNEHEYLIRIDSNFYEKIKSSNLKLSNLDIIALDDDFIAIKNKNNRIINCSKEQQRCNTYCLLYNKCDYCIMKKLQK